MLVPRRAGGTALRRASDTVVVNVTERLAAAAPRRENRSDHETACRSPLRGNTSFSFGAAHRRKHSVNFPTGKATAPGVRLCAARSLLHFAV